MSRITYDYLVVGAGLFGCTFAREMFDRGRRVLVIDKRKTIGGNCASAMQYGIDVHLYGAHIFHTNNKRVWDFINRFTDFNNFINSPLANFNGKMYNLPFNLNTFYALWGTKTPKEASIKLEEQRAAYANIKSPKNLEEKALTLVGKDVYETLIKGYTEKQWGRKATELPESIINRLPFRLTYDNNYFNSKYQGIPVDGYNTMFKKMLDGVEVRLEEDFFEDRTKYEGIAKNIVFTGKIDEYFDYCLGELEYRSLRFENEVLELDNYQGNAVVNYTDSVTPYTRIIEHKHFRKNESMDKTVITKEYPANYQKGGEAYYVINDEKNNALAAKYKALAEKEKNIIFGGRLAEYKYYYMDEVIESALEKVENHY